MLFYCLLIIPALTLASYDKGTCNGQEAWVERAWKIQTKAALKKVCPKTNEKLTYSLTLDCILKKIWASTDRNLYSLVRGKWRVHEVNLGEEEYDKYSNDSFHLMRRLRPSTWRWKWAYAYGAYLLCESAEMDRGANAYYACATYVLDYREVHWGFQYRFGCVFSDRQRDPYCFEEYCTIIPNLSSKYAKHPWTPSYGRFLERKMNAEFG